MRYINSRFTYFLLTYNVHKTFNVLQPASCFIKSRPSISKLQFRLLGLQCMTAIIIACLRCRQTVASVNVTNSRSNSAYYCTVVMQSNIPQCNRLAAAVYVEILRNIKPCIYRNPIEAARWQTSNGVIQSLFVLYQWNIEQNCIDWESRLMEFCYRTTQQRPTGRLRTNGVGSSEAIGEWGGTHSEHRRACRSKTRVWRHSPKLVQSPLVRGSGGETP